ncbi:LacI family DNA-binding transcriptional regulator [Actinomyces oris]|uniref:HTH lacI-type domain-containing protein n=1 Tax=Actinomyces oris TaxID=544580 RepID=A0A1Q8I3M7_9ACTO|nr:LacI family DNA-binding transcriptional regulator [Actinomyces oris]OLL15702.1 hypothetical protein BKH32_01595 [Actinomyces oris]
MVTQRDIARELGVAVSTVSRSLSDVPGIPETTKERVRQAAERLAYRRDAHAASLRTGRSGTISLVVGAIDNPFFAELAHHVETQANRLGLLLMIANGQEDPQAQERVALSMLEQRVDGMILVPVGPPRAGCRSWWRRPRLSPWTDSCPGPASTRSWWIPEMPSASWPGTCAMRATSVRP